MPSSQKYILDSNDELKSSLVTTQNKANLESGGLYKALTLTDSSNRDSANLESRDLINAAGDITLDWEALTFNGDWTAADNLAVSGNIDVSGDGIFVGNVSADTFSGNFVGNFSGDFDLSGIPESSALGIFTAANVTTDDVLEGSNNFYYTDDRFKDSINAVLDVADPLAGAYDQDGKYNISLTNIEGLVNTGKAIHVNNTSGTDTRGGLSTYDFVKPFTTIHRAKQDAVAGDTIIVWPGLYEEEYDLLATGVDYFFMPGTTVIQTSSYSNNIPIFRDSGGVTCNVLGYGQFITSSSTMPGVLSITDSSSKIRIQANLIQSTSATNQDNVIFQQAGNLELECRKIISSGLGVRTIADVTIIKNSYIESASGSAVATKGTGVFCFIDNCQIESKSTNTADGAIFINPGSAGTRVKNSILITAADHSIVTTSGSATTVNILAGNTGNKTIMNEVTYEALAPFTVDPAFGLTMF